jgi:hypothetical protein
MDVFIGRMKAQSCLQIPVRGTKSTSKRAWDEYPTTTTGRVSISPSFNGGMRNGSPADPIDHLNSFDRVSYDLG